MSQNANEVRIAIAGKIYTAPTATAPITNVATAIPVAWHDHGFTTPDGVVIAPKLDKYEVLAWQSYAPVRVVRLRTLLELKFTLLQTGQSNIRLAFGGGVFAANAAEWKYVAPTPGVADTRSLIIEAVDGAIVKRWYFPTAVLTDLGDIVLKGNEETRLACTMQVIGDNWTLFSNDPADDPAGAGGGGDVMFATADGGGGAIPSEPAATNGNGGKQVAAAA